MSGIAVHIPFVSDTSREVSYVCTSLLQLGIPSLSLHSNLVDSISNVSSLFIVITCNVRKRGKEGGKEGRREGEREGGREGDSNYITTCFV